MRELRKGNLFGAQEKLPATPIGHQASPKTTKAKLNIKDGEKVSQREWNDVHCYLKSHVICQYEKGGFVRAALCEKK